MKFFRSTDDVYENARAALDAVWGYPNATGTKTCIEPASTAPHDANGRVLLAVADEFVSYSPANEMLSQLIADGAVEEIDATTYTASADLSSVPD